MRRRVILDEPVVLFRRTTARRSRWKTAAATGRRRFRWAGWSAISSHCPYHGLQFDSSGKCVKVPSQDMVPPSAKVRAYPLVEKNHWIWIWTGDPAKADPALIEDFHWLDDPAWRFGGNYLHVDANYLLLVENLLDTTHLPFLHPDHARHRRVRALGVRGEARGRPHHRHALADERAAGAVPQADGRLSRRHEGRPLAGHALRPALLRQARRRLGAGRAPARARATARRA